MKKCSKCGELKELSEFNKKIVSKDGHRSECRKCHNEANRKWTHDNMDRCVKNANNWKVNNTEKHRLIQKKAHDKYKNNNRKKYDARIMTNAAIRSGELKRMPCEKCGCKNNIEAHHYDYQMPLNVKWLCTSCHKNIHKTN